MNKVMLLLLVGLVIITVISAGYLNQLPNECWIKYFCIPFKEIINIVVVVVAVYYFVEYKNDTRETKRHLDDLCEKLLNKLADDRMHIIRNKEDIMYLRVQQRIIKNELYLLKKRADKFGYVEDIDYCVENFEKYWNLISTHINDFSTLRKLDINLQNQLAYVVNRIETISLNLYK